jgi:transcriptional regulator with XRE-family HTH domain
VLRLRVKDVALEKGVGMAKLSRTSDIAYKTIQKIWRNPYHDASLSTINRIAKALGVPALHLLEEVPDSDLSEVPDSDVPDEYSL